MRLAASIVTVLALAAPASAQNVSLSAFAGLKSIHVLSRTTIPVRASGQLTVAFHGDRATGCATAGLCAYSGTTSWRPAPTGDLIVLSYQLHGHRGYVAGLVLTGNAGGGSVTVSEVRRATAQGALTTCADASQSELGTADLPVYGGILAIGLANASPGLLGTRCAGPRGADLAHALAARQLAIRMVLRGSRTIDFTTTRSFAARGFAGSVRSSVVLTLGRPRPQGSNQAPPGLQPPSTRIRLVTVSFRVTRVAGRVLARIAGASEPELCSTLDSCALTGMVAVEPRAFNGTGQLLAFGPARRPYRDFLAAIGLSRTGRRSGIQVYGSVQWDDRGAISEAFNQGLACRDASRLAAGTIQLAIGRGRLHASYSGAARGADVLRTRCPGPQAGSAELAAGSLPLSALASHSLTIPLSTGSALTDDGYSIRTIAMLTVTLQRERVTQRVLTQPGP